MVQSRYGIIVIGLAVWSGDGGYVKTDQPTTNYRPCKTIHEDELQGNIHFNQKRILETYAKAERLFQNVCAGTRTTVILVPSTKDPVFKKAPRGH